MCRDAKPTASRTLAPLLSKSHTPERAIFVSTPELDPKCTCRLMAPSDWGKDLRACGVVSRLAETARASHMGPGV